MGYPMKRLLYKFTLDIRNDFTFHAVLNLMSASNLSMFCSEGSQAQE